MKLEKFKTDFSRMKAKVERVNNQAAARQETGQILKLPVADIVVVSNVRKHFNESSIDELADSIKSVGQQSPITVRPHDSEPGKWVIITGERRFRAIQKLGQETILAREDDGNHTIAKQIVENIQREDMSILDIGRALKDLQDLEKKSVTEMAALIGKDRRYVYRALRVIELPPELQDLCVKNIIRDSTAIERLVKFIDKHQDWKGWIVNEFMNEVKSQIKKELIAQKYDEPIASEDEESESRETNDIDYSNVVISRKFFTDLQTKLERKLNHQEENDPMPLQDMPLTIANSVKLKGKPGYEHYKINGSEVRLTCMFRCPEVFGEKIMGCENDPLLCGQLTTITTDNPDNVVVEYLNELYEVPASAISLNRVVPLKDLKPNKS